jgi:predicted dehydrogenase
LWALQAGKDVYVEKPCSHIASEGRILVEAAKRHDRIVQHGTQSRSNPSFKNEVAAVRSGKYGKLLITYGYASKTRRSIGFKQPQEPPKELDFNLWLGPARQQPYHENLVHYNWHWFWDFGGGEIGNQGVHQLDIARWAMSEDAAPKSVISLGGRFGYKDQGETPNTQLTIIDFGEAKLFFEDRGLVNAKTTKVGNEFLTTEGVIKDGRFFPRGKLEGEPLPGVVEADVQQLATLTGKLEKSTLDPQQLHFDNFIDCVRSRKRENLNAPILEGHRTSMLCHLGNISYRLGTEFPMMHTVADFSADSAAAEAWGSMKQHLIDAAGIDPSQAVCRMGRKLQFDAAGERFVGDDEANKLLVGEYRAPFVVS